MAFNYQSYLSLPPAYPSLWLQLKPDENGYPGYPPPDPDLPEAQSACGGGGRGGCDRKVGI